MWGGSTAGSMGPESSQRQQGREASREGDSGGSEPRDQQGKRHRNGWRVPSQEATVLGRGLEVEPKDR